METATITIQGLYGWEASAASFLKFLKCSFGAVSKFPAVCYFQSPTDESLVQPILSRFIAAGGQLELESPLEEFVITDNQVNGLRLRGGLRDDFDHYISALSAYRFIEALPARYHTDPRFLHLSHVQSAYTVAVQLFYDRQVLPDGNTYISNRQGVIADAICDKSFHWPAYSSGGSIVQVLIDNGREFDRMPDAEIVAQVTDELARFFPVAGEAKLRKSVVLKHREIYTETRPNYWSAVLPAGQGLFQGLSLCGDWTAPPYHYGMESAVCSGIICANELLREAGAAAHPLLPVEFPKVLQAMANIRPINHRKPTQALQLQ